MPDPRASRWVPASPAGPRPAPAPPAPPRGAFPPSPGAAPPPRAPPRRAQASAPAATGSEVDPIHAIGIFGGAPSVGLRLYTDRTALSSAYDATGRIFELSSERNEGASVSFGGSPSTPALAAAFRLCQPDDPDTARPDHFRLELTTDSVKGWANGVRHFEEAGLPAAKQLPAALTAGGVDVYFPSWAYLGRAATERFHWGRIAINP